MKIRRSLIAFIKIMYSMISQIDYSESSSSFPLFDEFATPYNLSDCACKSRSRKGSSNEDSKLKFKTQTCKYWINRLQCPFGQNCNFAHGQIEQRAKVFLPTKYKTKICSNYSQDCYCPYGLRCRFIHRSKETSKLSHQAALDCLVKYPDMFFCFLEQKEKNSKKSSRLQIFQEICGHNKDQISTCYNTASESESDHSAESDYLNDLEVRSRHVSF